MKILGMDLGQNKSAWECWDTQTGEVTSGAVKMDAAALQGLLRRLQPKQLVVESGPLAARVYDLAWELGVPVLVADTTQDAWQWKNVKRKTDADDAGKLVHLAVLGQSLCPFLPSSLRPFFRQVFARPACLWNGTVKWM